MVVVWVLIALAVLVAIYLVVQYNSLIRLRNRIESAWAQIDVQLQRRYDLVPNLVETVKGYAAHEKQVLENVTAARAAAVGATGVAEQAKAETGFTAALRSLFAVSEAYPDLKANQNFLALQEELSGTEGRIAYARQYYNDTVQTYNNKVQAFPSNFVAGAFRFTEREYFEADDVSRAAVKVEF